ncbi:aldehyde-activating protein [Bradyrhizobium macuxiense]|uniref:Aldehyde-activating protein n=1 Tax=Bradyrhizobium macuxiense TaxID=1755647 RepID=A0A120FM03_9BRAD|nr:GFA family protein [Bradyrhizobium macuxiense]KWV53046.1 aldehyde-activating protein [Bradyrhizobium macuxiense]
MTEPARPSTRILAGECFCRAVRYEVADAFDYALNCHCSNCRRTTGSAFKPFAGIARERLTVVDGADRLMIYGDAMTHDAHCRGCGSLLYSVVREGAFVHVTMGTLRDTPAIRPTAHIFVASKAPWYDILDDLPQYREHVTADGE